jgi:hypothetical protein
MTPHPSDGWTSRQAGVDHSEGRPTSTGVKVVKPAGCKVSSEELTTTLLTEEVIVGPTLGSSVVFARLSAAGEPFITISFEGAECALAGNSAPVNETVCGERYILSQPSM